jgi:O-acetyl-ADP-ribose deacetylase (regulator of RNase III)
MPFQIIRNDITKVKADAIVNTANPRPIIGSGTDAAIYAAAGEEKLLAERKKIGIIPRGEARITPAFDLPAKYVIHTVGPKWHRGFANEFKILKNCYRNSLELALQNGCESIAFPLIASGGYGFPKDKALKIATSTIQDFLFENEMDVLLVVFDRSAFELSGKVFRDVQNFVDENYVKDSYLKEYWGIDVGENETPSGGNKQSEPTEAPPDVKNIFLDGIGEKSLDELVENAEDTFRERLFRLIQRSGMDEVTVYKRANLSKKMFSDMRNNENYRPKKENAVAYAIALKLSMRETQDLLARAGYALSPNNKFDRIVGYFISRGNYDMMTINEVLYANGQKCIGADKDDKEEKNADKNK